MVTPTTATREPFACVMALLKGTCLLQVGDRLGGGQSNADLVLGTAGFTINGL